MTTAVVRQQFGRYAVIGLISNSVCYLTFLSLLWIAVSPVVTNAACYLLGLALRYVANRSWTFKSSNGHLSDLLRFGGAYAPGILMSVLSMSLLVRIISVPLAQILTIGVTAIVIFCAQRLVRFGPPGSPAVNSIR